MNQYIIIADQGLTIVPTNVKNLWQVLDTWHKRSWYVSKQVALLSGHLATLTIGEVNRLKQEIETA
jgi:hypothetical protein